MDGRERTGEPQPAHTHPHANTHTTQTLASVVLSGRVGVWGRRRGEEQEQEQEQEEGEQGNGSRARRATRSWLAGWGEGAVFGLAELTRKDRGSEPEGTDTGG